MNRRGFFKMLGISPVVVMLPGKDEEYEIIPCDIWGVLKDRDHVIHRIRKELIVDIVTGDGTVIYTNDNSRKPRKVIEGDKITIDITKVGSSYYGDLKIHRRR